LRLYYPITYLHWSWIVLLLGLVGLSGTAYAQGGGPPGSCNPISVDLRGQPSGVFDTTGLIRANRCCGSNNCVQFDVQLDPAAIAFKVEITSGAVPGGSITYEIDCSGNPRFPGNTVCVNNKDSFSITFCKPGNNPNGYRITSKPKPMINGDSVVFDGCSGLMTVDSFTDSTIQWSSVTHDPFYDSFLSCTSGCDTTYINLKKGFPDTIRYRVSGIPSYQCATDTVYDTLMVHLKDSLTTQIEFVEDSLTCSSQQDSATLKAKTKGGTPPYSYQWNTGSATQSIRADTGQYSIKVTDKGYCQPDRDTFQFNAKAIQMTNPTINGRDTICGINDTAVYYTADNPPNTYQWQVSSIGTIIKGQSTDSADIRWDSAGQGEITLTETNKAGCDSTVTDSITVSRYPNPAIQGKDTVCAFTDSHAYNTAQKTGSQYAWSTSGGSIQSGSGTHRIAVDWRKAGSGSVSLVKTGDDGCQQTNQQVIVIRPKPSPLINSK
jgi:hypothetical protein